MATSQQRAWFAGIYEGEGSVAGRRRQKNGSINYGNFIVVGQQNTWLLYKLRRLFGGGIGKKRQDGCRCWVLCGVPARKLLRSVYHLLSPRRQRQIRKADVFSAYYGSKGLARKK